jgi:hypothetical protein
MGNVTTALVIVMFINLLSAITTISMANLYENGKAPTFCTVTGTAYETMSPNGILNTSDIPGLFPGNSQATSPTTGNIFTDVFNSIKNWMLSVPGLNYVYMIISSPACLITQLNLPGGIGGLIAGFWYCITVFLIIAFLWWRD